MGEEPTVDNTNKDEIVEKKKQKKKKSKDKKKDKKTKIQDDDDDGGDTAIADEANDIVSKEKKQKKKKKEKKQKKKKEEKETKELQIEDGQAPLKVEEDSEDKDANGRNHSASINDNNENVVHLAEETNDKEQNNSDHHNNNNDMDDEDESLAKKRINHDDDNESGDDRKIFLSRIPDSFNEDSITRNFERVFGEGCIDEIALCTKREEYNAEGDENEHMKKSKDQDSTPHRGFAFVTMSSDQKCREAIAKGTIRGTAKDQSKRKHTMYIRPIVREEEGGSHEGGADESKAELNICFLWSKYRCPYGDDCKFKHTGEGGCIEKNVAKDDASRMKKQKCFSFRTKGKCKLGDKCPYSHDIKVKCTVISDGKETMKKDPKDKDCISWKTKGKCRRRDKCPYRHDESVREAFLAKKEKKNSMKKRGRSDNPQPLSVRVFGLNYDTNEEDIRAFFEHCGPIREITFPTFEDSGRSKGYCGVLFTSPKATDKATEMDGSELHGRWLSIQAGKMYLKQWEEREQERTREMKGEEVKLGEFGQKVKKRKKHGFSDS